MILDTRVFIATYTVLDIFLASLDREHPSFPDERVFIDILASEDPTSVSDGTHIPRLMIRRLGPLVQAQHLGKYLWLAQEPCQVCVHYHPIWHIPHR